MRSEVDFLGIGAPRAGTTYLDSVLRSHPALHLPEARKEVHFFDDSFQRGREWYASYFAEAGSDQLRGEVTPSYLDHHDAVKRIVAFAPDVRAIVVVRDPVLRAFSHHSRLQAQRADRRSFNEALVPGSRVFDASLYGRHLSRWLEHLPPDRLLVLEADSLFDHSAFGDLAAFLGVEARGFSAPSQRVNAGTDDFSAVGRAMKKVSRFAYRRGLDGAVDYAKRVLSRSPIDPRRGAPTRRISPTEYESARHMFHDDLEVFDGLCGARPRQWWPQLWA